MKRLSIAAVVMLAAFPVILIGLNAQSSALIYLGLFLLGTALLSVPITKRVVGRKKEKYHRAPPASA